MSECPSSRELCSTVITPTSSYGVSALSVVNLILIIIIIIALIILFYLFVTNRSEIINQGIAYNIIMGTSSATTDTMVANGNNLYIARSTSPLTLTIQSGQSNINGRYFLIKNNSTNNVTLVGGTGVTLNAGRLNLSVTPGQTAQFVNMGGSGSFLRLQ